MANAFNAQSDPGVVFKFFSASQQSMRSIIASRSININTVALCVVFCKYRSHRIESPYHSINHQLQKSEAFQSVHHVTFILCYTVLYDFLGLRCRFGRHRAEVHRTSCALVFALIRVRKH